MYYMYIFALKLSEGNSSTFVNFGKIIISLNLLIMVKKKSQVILGNFINLIFIKFF